MIVFAHRGYSGKFPENTRPAFEAALELHAPGIELDVHLTKDRELIVTHDFDFGRTVKATGTPLDYTARELAKLDAGSFKGEEFKGVGLLTIEDVLELIQKKSLLNIEIKEETLKSESDYTEMCAKLLTLTKAYGLKDILFSSFDAHALEVLRSQSKEARIALLDDTAEERPRLAEIKAFGAEAYNVNLHRVTKGFVDRIHSAGFKVNAYTCGNADDLALAKSLGLDGVFADNLEEALAFFKT